MSTLPQTVSTDNNTENALIVATPLDLPVEVFQAGLDRRGQNRNALMKWLGSALVEGVDYGRIHVVSRAKCQAGNRCTNPAHFSKPSLFKPGAEKICGMLGVSPTFPSLKEYEQKALDGVEIRQIVLRCVLVSAHGQELAEGIGARSVVQDQGDLNKSMKMAEKSAQIDATLRLGGLSEVFTQDIEDMIARGELEPASKPKAAPAAPIDTAETISANTDPGEIPANNGTYNGQKGLVGSQTKSHKALEAALRDAGLANHRERVKAYILKNYSVRHFPELTIEQANELRALFPRFAAKIAKETEAKAQTEMQTDFREIARMFEALESHGYAEYERCMQHYGVKSHTELVQKKDRDSLIHHLKKTAQATGVKLEKAEPEEIAVMKKLLAEMRASAERADNGDIRREELREAAKLESKILAIEQRHERENQD